MKKGVLLAAGSILAAALAIAGFFCCPQLKGRSMHDGY